MSLVIRLEDIIVSISAPVQVMLESMFLGFSFLMQCVLRVYFHSHNIPQSPVGSKHHLKFGWQGFELDITADLPAGEVGYSSDKHEMPVLPPPIW